MRRSRKNIERAISILEDLIDQAPGYFPPDGEDFDGVLGEPIRALKISRKDWEFIKKDIPLRYNITIKGFECADTYLEIGGLFIFNTGHHKDDQVDVVYIGLPTERLYELLFYKALETRFQFYQISLKEAE